MSAKDIEDDLVQEEMFEIDRTPRILETRVNEQAPMTWRPVSKLPDPPKRPGWRHRYIRRSVRNSDDSVNFTRAMQEGWTPCTPTDYPELVTGFIAPNGDSSVIEFGGLILCRMPEELALQRDAYYENRARRQIGAVNRRLQSVVDQGGLAIDNKSKTRVSNKPF